MSINSIGANNPTFAQESAKKAQSDKELTTVTVNCEKDHNHDQSCPHSVSTVPEPKMGENGYLLNKTI